MNSMQFSFGKYSILMGGNVANGSINDCDDPIDYNLCISPCKCLQTYRNDCPLEASAENSGFIDYSEFYYCTMHDLSFFGAFLMILWLFFLFYLLVSTTQSYFIPALSRLTERLGLSVNVSGVTLLSFGNSMSDVFSGFTAITHHSVQMGFGGLLGASMFINSVVLGFVLISSGTEINVPKRPFLRDSICLLIAVVGLFIVLDDGILDWWEGFLLVFLYVLYFVIVIISSYIYKRGKLRRRADLGIEDTIDHLVGEDSNSSANLSTEEVFLLNNTELSSSFGDTSIDDEEFTFSSQKRGFSRFVASCCPSLSKWNELSLMEKLFFVITGPSNFVRRLTIPPIGNEDWSRIIAVVNPSCSLLFILLIANDFLVTILGFPVAVLLLLIGIVLGTIIYFTSSNEEPPVYYTFLLLIAFLMSSCWIYAVANEIVSLLKIVGDITQLSGQILGLTAVAWGNSMVDLITNVVLSRRGLSEMALSACLGATMLKFLLIPGFSILFETLESGPFSVDISTTLIVTFAFLFSIILTNLTYIAIRRFTLTRKYGIFLLVVYMIFAILSALTEVDVIVW